MKKPFIKWGLITLFMLWKLAGAQVYLNRAEYFYDSDPGPGHGTAVTITSPADTVTLNLGLPTTGLSEGIHNLFMRFQYTNGAWGLYQGSPFYLFAAGSIVNTAQINHAEYFFDTDPGLGNGTSIAIASPSDTSNLSLSISTTGLSNGFHNLFVRYRYNNGTWGLYRGSPFYIFTGAITNTAQINHAEYFFDNDPGRGQGTAINIATPADTANLALNISTSGLSSGFHNLFVRYQYNNGTWGLYQGSPFYIFTGTVANSAEINSAEYFFDTDPGLGNGTAITIATPTDTSSVALSISTTGLSNGFHNLFVRYRYNNSAWGLYQGSPFYIFTGTVANSARISNAEYFFDRDPGLGNGTAITVSTPADTVNLALSISTTALTAGFHNLFVRYQYNNGTWGLYQGSPFYIFNTSVINTAQINQAEYFYDHDPGVGNGTAIAVGPTDTATLTLALTTTGLSSGFHNLFIRFRYNNGIWGLYQGSPFYIYTGAVLNTAEINKAEYFFDHDPGIGNGTPVTIVPTDTATLMLNNVSTAGLSRGYHYLFFRFRYNNGTWGLYQGDRIDICNPPNATITPGGTISYCFGDSVVLHADTGSTLSYQWYRNDNIITGATHNKFTVYDSSGSYTVMVTDTDGCDSVSVPVIVNVSNQLGSALSESICTGNSYNFNGRILTASGTYYDTITVGGGCDSIVTLMLTVSSVINTALSASICAGSSFLFNGLTLTAAGVYHDSLTSSGGCDSVVTLTLTVNEPVTHSISAAICSGSSYLFNGLTLTNTGTYYDTLQASNGCDSIVTLELSVNQQVSDTLNAGICAGNSYPLNGQNLTVAGTYIDTLTASSGCDSIVTLILTVNPVSYDTFSAAICGGSYSFNGQNLTASGTYTDTLTGSSGCDSMVILQLTVNTLYDSIMIVGICQGDTFIFNGTAYYTSTTVSDTFTGVNGCDSINGLHLTVNQPTTSSVRIVVCNANNYVFNGDTLTSAGTYIDTLNGSNSCDSIVTLNLLFKNGDTTQFSQTICQGAYYPFNGSNLTVAGVYVDSLTSHFGCDSIIMLRLSVDTPTVSWTGGTDSLCITSGATALSGGAPVGGAYSGDGVTSGIFNPDSAGVGAHVITYTYTDSLQCSDAVTRTFVVDICTGISAAGIENSIRIYPNPASDMLNVDYELSNEMHISISILDVTGRNVATVYEGNPGAGLHHSQISLNDLAQAVYVLHFTGDAVDYNFKFVKQ